MRHVLLPAAMAAALAVVMADPAAARAQVYYGGGYHRSYRFVPLGNPVQLPGNPVQLPGNPVNLAPFTVYPGGYSGFSFNSGFTTYPAFGGRAYYGGGYGTYGGRSYYGGNRAFGRRW